MVGKAADAARVVCDFYVKVQMVVDRWWGRVCTTLGLEEKVMSIARSRIANRYAALAGWNMSALGADAAPVTFYRLSNNSPRTLAEWQKGLSDGTFEPDGVDSGVPFIKARAWAGGQWRTVIVSDGWGGSNASSLYNNGGWIPHPTLGAVQLPKFVFGVNKSYDQMAEEAKQQASLRCPIKSKGCTGWVFQTCGGSEREDFTDAQAVAFAKSINKVVECTGIGPRSGAKFAVFPSGTIEDMAKQVPPPGPDSAMDWRCPASNFKGYGDVTGSTFAMMPGTMAVIDDVELDYRLGGKSFKGQNVSKKDIDYWTRKNNCKNMACINRNTGEKKTFNYCPSPFGPFIPPPKKGGFFDELGPVGTAGLIGGGALLLFAMLSD
jgi:hypothetical protein